MDAQPRHVYFQTLTLFRKANRLAVELAGAERMAPPPVLEAEIAPADVYDPATTLLSELAHLTLVLDAKDVPAPAVERPKHVFPAHVYRMAGMLQDDSRGSRPSSDPDAGGANALPARAGKLCAAGVRHSLRFPANGHHPHRVRTTPVRVSPDSSPM